MEVKKNIRFKLRNIITEQFATFEIDKIPETHDLKSELQFAVNTENKVVSCKMNFQFLHQNSPLVTLKVVCNFDVEPKSWEKDLMTTDKIILPKHFLEHLCAVTVGTARGVLHAKTENTHFNRLMIPTFNVSNLVEKDVVFEIK